MFILIKADENGVSSIETIDKMKMSLDEYYRALNCSCISVQPCGMQVACMPKQFAVFDDEFLLKTNKPVANKLASALYGYHKHGQCLCGNVIIGTVGDEDIKGFTKQDADEIVKLYTVLMVDANGLDYDVQEPFFTYVGMK